MQGARQSRIAPTSAAVPADTVLVIQGGRAPPISPTRVIATREIVVSDVIKSGLAQSLAGIGCRCNLRHQDQNGSHNVLGPKMTMESVIHPCCNRETTEAKAILFFPC